ncbi:hypothetical protein [Thermogemmatispora carboxidivorans]|uniref:hypothetical protein n=1 Tax=Thermogemmatispora carboxidivorans TaxID=1382306 RepID=UPI00069ADD86|nr:hypothetical protein [Thermogemmatispora carboxidivorans]
MRIAIELVIPSWKEAQQDPNIPFLFDLPWLITRPDFCWLTLTLPDTTSWSVQVPPACPDLRQDYLLQYRQSGRPAWSWTLDEQQLVGHPVFLRLGRELDRLLREELRGVFHAQVGPMIICLRHEPGRGC